MPIQYSIVLRTNPPNDPLARGVLTKRAWQTTGDSEIFRSVLQFATISVLPCHWQPSAGPEQSGALNLWIESLILLSVEEID